MYKKGKKVKEIAETQGFVISTIENHLSRFVASGEIKIEEFVSQNIVNTISDYFDKQPNSPLSEAKIALPDEYTYSQIKLVQRHLEFIKSVQN